MFFSSCFLQIIFSGPSEYTDVQLSLPFISYPVVKNKIESCSAKHANSLNALKALLPHAATSSSFFVLRVEWRSRKRRIKEFPTSYLGKWVTQHLCGSSFTNNATCHINTNSEEGSMIVMCIVSKWYIINFSLPSKCEVLSTKTNLSYNVLLVPSLWIEGDSWSGLAFSLCLRALKVDRKPTESVSY